MRQTEPGPAAYVSGMTWEQTQKRRRIYSPASLGKTGLYCYFYGRTVTPSLQPVRVLPGYYFLAFDFDVAPDFIPAFVLSVVFFAAGFAAIEFQSPLSFQSTRKRAT